MSARSSCVLSLAVVSIFTLTGCGQTDEQVLAEQGYSVELADGGFSLGQQLPPLAVEDMALWVDSLERGR